ncbi:response regulator transcription factor [Oceanobacillus manasiensis]|uniref:response regulator transcription factor n=1 Tax=Oceanobacillus manasiensis TaxID=586413 RepID=UPI0005A9F7F9|nr:response regulator transcription factor [Oceanobacillus manasiensis]
MLHVLLIDDEPLIVEGLQALIDWESLGCRIVGTANSAEEALKTYSDTACDLAITDIRMSSKSGLELIEAWQQFQPSTRWIVLSGYQEFDYVKKGLELGIENYLVKPVNEEELVRTVEQVKRKLYLSNQQSIRKYVLRDNAIWSYLHDEIQQEEFEARMEISDMGPFNSYRKLAFLTFPEVHTFSEEKFSAIQNQLEQAFKTENAICCITPESDFLLLFPTDEITDQKVDNKISHFVEESIRLPYILFMGEKGETKAELKNSLSQAISHRDHYAFFNDIKITSEASFHEVNNQLKPIHMEALLKAINERDTRQAKDWVSKTLLVNTSSSDQVKSGALEVVMAINAHSAALERVTLSKVIDEMLKSRTIAELSDQIDTIIENAILHMKKDKEINHSLVEDVIEYLQTGYSDEISLKLLGQKFYINPIYLGQLFHKEIGISFSEYLNEMRLEKAKDLLLHTHEKAGKIGKKAGYSDPTYFYKQFKKHYGVTPNEYRTINK